jgi:hypothetical protein
LICYISGRRLGLKLNFLTEKKRKIPKEFKFSNQPINTKNMFQLEFWRPSSPLLFLWETLFHKTTLPSFILFSTNSSLCFPNPELPEGERRHD